MLLRAGISKDARTKVDKTPVHIAAQEGHSDVLELLLKNGSDVEAVDMVRFESFFIRKLRPLISSRDQ